MCWKQAWCNQWIVRFLSILHWAILWPCNQHAYRICGALAAVSVRCVHCFTHLRHGFFFRCTHFSFIHSCCLLLSFAYLQLVYNEQANGKHQKAELLTVLRIRLSAWNCDDQLGLTREHCVSRVRPNIGRHYKCHVELFCRLSSGRETTQPETMVRDLWQCSTGFKIAIYFNCDRLVCLVCALCGP